MGRMILALTVAAVAGAGCSSQRCEEDLAYVGGGCPRTFDGTEAQLPACGTLPAIVTARRCRDVISIEYTGNFTTIGCYYDASSHELIGAVEGSTSLSYCNGTSDHIYAGDVAGACLTEPLATKDCRSQP